MLKQYHILVIDDNEDDCMVYERICSKIETQNYHLSCCYSGEDGLAYLQNHSNIDCILLDYSLPGRNGVSVLKDIRTSHPNIPVIMLTGQGSESIAVEVMKSGAQDYIIKSSINPQSMQRLLSTTIEHCNMQNKIEDQRKSLALFARAMAHDLKEPIRSINSFSQLIHKSGALDGKNARYMEFITSSAAHMENLMQNVAHYTKIDAMTDPKMEKIDLAECAAQTIINLQPLIDEYGASVTIKTLPVIQAYPTQMVQLLQNLVGNAIRYCPEDRTPTVTVYSEESNDSIVISVKDNGDGIEDQFREQIFMPFKRLVGRKIAGTGLGLAISKKIIELHNGKLWHENAADGGSIFHFSLPAELHLNQNSSSERKSSFSINQKSIFPVSNVLLVEDNPLDVELARLLLLEEQDVEFNLHAVSSAERALNWLQTPSNPKIDLILLDINMPGMNGLELLSILKQDKSLKHIPVSMLSTSNDEEDISKARELGACDYMTKPPSMEHFMNIAKQAAV